MQRLTEPSTSTQNAVMRTDLARKFRVPSSAFRNRLWLPALVALSLLAAGQALRAQVPLSSPQGLGLPSQPFSNSANPRCIAVGDLNNDGIPDVVSLTSSAPYVHIALGQGNRTFVAGPSVPLAPFSACVALADLNHDGNLDLILGDYNQGGIWVYFGDGHGGFTSIFYYPGTAQYPVDIAVADFDGDGNLDVALDSVYNSRVEIFNSNSQGVMTPGRVFDNSGVVLGMAVADFDGDNAPDLFLSAYYGSTRQLFYQLRNPNGVSLATIGVNGIGAQMTSVAAGNLLGNGHASLLMTDGSGIYLVPRPLEAGSPRIGLPSNNARFAMFGDLNGDGALDMIAGSLDPANSTNATNGRIEYYQSVGNGSFAPVQYFNPGRGRISAAVVADLDGDGHPDLVVAPATGNSEVYVMWNNVPAAPTITTTNHATFVAGQTNSFVFNAKGYPSPAFSTSSALPSGVTLSPSGVLGGIPAQNAAGVYSLSIMATNGVSPAAIQNFNLTVQATVPAVTSPYFSGVKSTTAALGGTVTDQGMSSIIKRGILYVPTAVNPSPAFGGTGVLEVDDPLPATGGFYQTVINLTPQTTYSFVAFASNSIGVGYSTVATFQTLPPPGSGSLIVTTAVDEDDGSSDPSLGTGTSLREAVEYANLLGTNSTITFSTNLFTGGAAVITLTNKILVDNITGKTTIAGPGPQLLTITGVGAGNWGLFEMDNGSGEFDRITFANRRTAADGAVLRSYGTLTLATCVFSNNAGGSGGAIYNGGSGTVLNSTFLGNTAAFIGGAIANEGVLSVANSTFFGNAATNSGGAMANLFGASQIAINCSTITANAAAVTGGGLGGSGVLTINNSIVSGNSAPAGINVSGPFAAASSLIDSAATNIFATGQLADNGGPTPTVALNLAGPAVNAGNLALVPAGLTTDQRGKLRPQFGALDIGAFELTPFDTGQTIVFTGGAYWYFGPAAIGNDWHIYREVPGTVPSTMDGSGSRIGLAADGTLLVEASDGYAYFRIGSSSGPGSGWQRNVSMTAQDGATWFLGPDGNSTDANIYRWASGGPPTQIDGVALRLGQANDGTVLVQNSANNVYDRIGSTNGPGIFWDPLSFVIAGDGATWFLGADGTGSDAYIYRWAVGAAPVYSSGFASELSTTLDGVVLARNSANDLYRRVGSNAGLGTFWQLLLPLSTPSTLNLVKPATGGLIAFAFTNEAAGRFTVLTSTNVAASAGDWMSVGRPFENPAGQYQFTNSVSAVEPQRFYRVTSP